MSGAKEIPLPYEIKVWFGPSAAAAVARKMREAWHVRRGRGVRTFVGPPREHQRVHADQLYTVCCSSSSHLGIVSYNIHCFCSRGSTIQSNCYM
jgi:hypothetical protein